ncbi:MAG: EAL and HDOD domain-containing protein [Vicinamibacterales bacterium]
MAAASEHTHIARQPILDARNQVYGYELLFRASREATSFEEPGNASARLISDAVSGPGFDALSDGRRVFVNLSSDVLLSDVTGLFDPERVVFEVPADLPVTPEIAAMCARLHAHGHALALDGFAAGLPAEALLPHARFVKVDALDTPLEDIAALTAGLLARGLTVIAERLETEEAFQAARAAGCSLFQGYYFCRPQTVSVKAMAASQITQMQLLAALMRPNVPLADIEELLKRDTTLSYRVLRTVNSAGFGLRREIGSIREALLMLGLDQVRKWASLWTLAALNKGPSELLTMTIVRARTCETVGQALGRAEQGYFLLGMCSLLDALLGQPMDKVVAELPVNAEIRGALLGEPNHARQVLDAVARYERAEWLESSTAAAAVGLDEDTLPQAYLDALAWARKVTQAAGQAA